MNEPVPYDAKPALMATRRPRRQVPGRCTARRCPAGCGLDHARRWECRVHGCRELATTHATVALLDGGERQVMFVCDPHADGAPAPVCDGHPGGRCGGER